MTGPEPPEVGPIYIDLPDPAQQRLAARHSVLSEEDREAILEWLRDRRQGRRPADC